VSVKLHSPRLFKHAETAVGTHRMGDGMVHYVGDDDGETRGICICKKSNPVSSVVQPTVLSLHCLRHTVIKQRYEHFAEIYAS